MPYNSFLNHFFYHKNEMSCSIRTAINEQIINPDYRILSNINYQ